VFEQLSALKINFYKKIELFCFGEAQDEAAQYIEHFACEQGLFSFRNLGIVIQYFGLTNN
jgi:hypothetical protein